MSLRVLVLGHPKSGKTGAFCSLANAGWTIRYLDFDDNSDPLINFTRPESRSNIQIVRCVDEYRMTESAGTEKGATGKMEVQIKMQKAVAWKAMSDALTVKWPIDDSKPWEWDPNRNILIFDSLTNVAESKVRMHMWVNGRDGSRKEFQDYTHTQDTITGLLKMLKLGIRCPVFILGHLQPIGPDLEADTSVKDETARWKQLQAKLDAAEKIPWGWGPVTIGKAQARTLAVDFSGTVLVEAKMMGREIKLRPEDGLPLGLPIPGLKYSYPIETGMADIMKAWAASIPKSES